MKLYRLLSILKHGALILVALILVTFFWILNP